MTVSSLEPPKHPSTDDAGGLAGPFFLSCPYCHWSTLDIGVEFEKHTGITQQLARIKNGGQVVPSLKEREKAREKRREARDGLAPAREDISVETSDAADPTSHEEVFYNLSSFYKSQLSLGASSQPFSPHHDINFSSPSSFSRIMNLYSSASSKKQKRDKPPPMREASSVAEGLTIHSSSSDHAAIQALKLHGWDHTLTYSQKNNQLDQSIRFASELRPSPTLLCTKRGKRCRACRHILSKPEPKITSTRYKIKLLASNHIPRLSIRALSASLPLPTVPSSAAQGFDYSHLQPATTIHFLLTVSNPLFEPVRITLATPSTIMGKVKSKVTILCPQFDVGANTDVWDEALSSAPARRGGPSDSSSGVANSTQVEAGKIWERGRNWTSIILEVVPGIFEQHRGPTFGGGQRSQDDDDLAEDEDVLEIPIFVRIEYESDVAVEDRAPGTEHTRLGGKEKREEAFWSVLGVGRIKSLP
ncbi:uncharacterized protein BDZ99DRAFT_468616 [Mytilinidion resinicola]|uniref:Dynactin subunit 4 n=1 Tax=Mytilinidion resinicola TaxID=574789 RepID=A0A6A6Y2B1_9PEZI|nr:uncharacterized protein BDZ99DRAFT_468616 [Mytilinidion resinicola]KAF2802956.1 hypothetical protein BDZ99DRAFT_468616 [Mytilinidion resinicola]